MCVNCFESPVSPIMCKKRRTRGNPAPSEGVVDQWTGQHSPHSHEAGSVALDKEDNLARAIHVMILSCVQHLAANQRAACLDNDEALHQMRIALRRLGAVLSVFKPYLPARARRDVGARLKALLKALGPARDIEVFLADSETLFVTKGRKDINRGLIYLRRTLERMRDDARRKASAAIRSPHYHALLSGALTLQPGTGRGTTDAGGPVRPYARAYLKRRRAAIIRKLGHLGQLSAKEQHKLRVAIKKLRYATEFFIVFSDHPGRARRALKLMKQLQDALGRLNDLTIHQEIMAGLLNRGIGRKGAKNAFAFGFLEGEQEILGRDYLRAARRLGRRVAHEKRFWH
jgi:CHAD domain-containing protein